MGFDYSTARCGGSPSLNMHSAREHPEVVREYLARECSDGRVLGPLDPLQFPFIHTSKFGVIPKGSSGKWRLIVDLSSPEGSSVNGGISEKLSSLTYVGIEDAVKGIVGYGKGTLLAKVDVKHAYRNIPVHPDDRWLLGMTWEGALYIDTALPFGLRSAPKIFTAIADAVEWIARRQGVRFSIHYLDDFLIVGAPDSSECAVAVEKLIEIFECLGLPVAADKREGPATQLEFLGFEIDTVEWEVRLPHRKLIELREAIGQWVGRKSCSKKELESIIGKLGHAARVVLPGKTFMRRMFELLGTARKSHYRVRLNRAFQSDLAWWDSFLESWNGVSLLRGLVGARSSAQVWTDASGRFGCGAWYPERGLWIQVPWPSVYGENELELVAESIALKELLPIVLACAVWGSNWAGSSVTVHCDNTGAVEMVNSGYSRVPQIMHLLRCLFFIRARHQVDLRAVHVRGVANAMADAISRNNLNFLFSQAPGAREGRIEVPPALMALLVQQQPDWTSEAWRQLFRSCFRPA